MPRFFPVGPGRVYPGGGLPTGPAPVGPAPVFPGIGRLPGVVRPGLGGGGGGVNLNQDPRILGTFKKGGKVKKTGLYKLHQGEKVVPVKAVKAAAAGTIAPKAAAAAAKAPAAKAKKRDTESHAYNFRNRHGLAKSYQMPSAQNEEPEQEQE